MKPVRNVTPDKLDLRDRPYLPAVALAPPPILRPRRRAPVLDQASSSACTGFALATVVNRLLAASARAREAPVSPWMLYSMARRYDEFPGAAADAGSSLRGALKGWYKHGACAARLWSGPDMPRPARRASEDWWQDAVNRPLGAYYRVDFRSVTDMHVALNETGVLYASAIAHRGWLEGDDARRRKGFVIPQRPRVASDGGHAFAIVGYDRAGFLVQNSWGTGWGDAGFATLPYEDWLENAMDCWVAQIGVVTEEHRRVASSAPGAARARRALSPNALLRNHELAPYVIDMENDGRLSSSGAFRTTEEDVRALAEDYLDGACREWGLAKGEPVDIALYVHGGLVGEAEAAETFARWMPALFAARRFPVFLMWESDVLSQLRDRLADLLEQAARPAARPLEALQRWWDERIEGMVAPAGTLLWEEMKQNAAAISSEGSGGRMFFEALARSAAASRHPPRLHLVGHSAGSIALAYLVDRIAAQEWDFASVTFLAPAIRVDLFAERVLPWLESGRIARFAEYHLTDAAEQRDPSMRALAGYSRSLLFLVSRAFEGHAVTPILGMQRWFPPALERMKSVRVVTAPSEASHATTHSGFDEDDATIASVVAGLRPASRKRR